MPQGYCVTCKHEAHHQCGRCNSVLYCSKECQRHDFTLIHQHECALYTLAKSGGDTGVTTKPQGITKHPHLHKHDDPVTSQLNRKIEKDRTRKEELQRVTVAIVDAMTQMKRAEIPESEKRLHLDKMSTQERNRVLKGLEESLSISRPEFLIKDLSHKLFYIRKLDEMGALVSSSLPRADGSKREIPLVKDSPELLKKLAKYYRLKEVMLEKTKLAFLTNNAEDLEESTRWFAKVEHYNNKMIHKWLFGDDMTFQAAQMHRKELHGQLFDLQFKQTTWDAVLDETLDRYAHYLADTESGAKPTLSSYGVKYGTKKTQKTTGTKGTNADEEQAGGEKSPVDPTIVSIEESVGDMDDGKFKLVLGCMKDIVTKMINLLGPGTRKWVKKNIIKNETLIKTLDTLTSLKHWLFNETEELGEKLNAKEDSKVKLSFIEQLQQRISNFGENVKKRFNWKTVTYLLTLVAMSFLIVSILGLVSDSFFSAVGPAKELKGNAEALQASLATNDINVRNLYKQVEEMNVQFRDQLDLLKGANSISISSLRANDYGDLTTTLAVNTEVNTLLQHFTETLAKPETAEHSQIFLNSIIKNEIMPFLGASAIDEKRALLVKIQQSLKDVQSAFRSQQIAVSQVENILESLKQMSDSIFRDGNTMMTNLNTTATLAKEVTGKRIDELIDQIKRTEVSAGGTYTAVKWFGMGLEETIDHGTAEMMINASLKDKTFEWIKAGTGPFIQQCAQIEHRARSLVRETAKHLSNSSWITGLFGVVYEWLLGRYDAVTSSYYVISAMSTITWSLSHTLRATSWLVGYIPTNVVDKMWNLITLTSNEQIEEENKEAQKIAGTIQGTNSKRDQLRDLEALRKSGGITYRVYFKALEYLQEGGLRENVHFRTSLDAYRYNLNDVDQQKFKPVLDILQFYYLVKLAYRIYAFFSKLFLLFTVLSSSLIFVLSLVYVFYVVGHAIATRHKANLVSDHMIAPFRHMVWFYVQHPFISEVALGVVCWSVFWLYPATDELKEKMQAFIPAHAQEDTPRPTPVKEDTSYVPSFFMSEEQEIIGEDIRATNYIEQLYDETRRGAGNITSTIEGGSDYFASMNATLQNVWVSLSKGNIDFDKLQEEGFIVANITQ